MVSPTAQTPKQDGASLQSLCVVYYISHKTLGYILEWLTMKFTVNQNVHQCKAVLSQGVRLEALLSGLNILTMPIFSNLVSFNK